MATFFDTLACENSEDPFQNPDDRVRHIRAPGHRLIYLFCSYSQNHHRLRNSIPILQSCRQRFRQMMSRSKSWMLLRQEVKNLQEKLRLLKEQLPPGNEVSGLLRQIQNLVNQSGLSLRLWEPKARKKDKSELFEQIPIAVQFTGDLIMTSEYFSTGSAN